jgi:hypothetical protein
VANAATKGLSKLLEEKSMPAEYASQIIQSFQSDNAAAALEFIVNLARKPEQAVLSLVGRAEELGLDDLSESLKSVLKDRMMGGLKGFGLSDDVAGQFAEGVGAMGPEEMEEKLSSLASETEKLADPKDVSTFRIAATSGIVDYTCLSRPFVAGTCHLTASSRCARV